MIGIDATPGGCGPRRVSVLGMKSDDIVWNEEARAKILNDADRVLREAVLELAQASPGISSDDAFAELNSRLKDRFIDWEPGPDLRKYADAIAGGDIESA